MPGAEVAVGSAPVQAVPVQAGDVPAGDAQVAVVTVVAGRHQHLRAQRAALASLAGERVRHVVVALDDPSVTPVLAEAPGLDTELLTLPSTVGGLPVAAARNAGARAALRRGADLLVFLDVDCIPGPQLIARYRSAATARPHALLCGPVTYLPPAPEEGWRQSDLPGMRAPHPARPDPGDGELVDGDAALFWSLSFAIDAGTWSAIAPFYEGYVGYGAEDTDFARCAAAAGVAVTWVGGADAFHQHHPTSTPPHQHLDDIVRNAGVFTSRHADRPMGGWLDAFEAEGLVTRDGDRYLRSDAVRVATIPARHAYVDAVLPPTVRRHDVDRVQGWAPDPLFDLAELERRRETIDVLHLHFGFDHLTPPALQRWLGRLNSLDLPLVYTLHDLRNPHHDDRTRHDDHLASVLDAATRVVTLTEGAAAEAEKRFGRRPDVLPHPTLLPAAIPSGRRPDGRPVVLVPLKALRANTADPMAVVRAVAAGATAADATVHVLLHPPALDRVVISDLVDAGGVDAGGVDDRVVVDVRPYLDEDELLRLLAGVDVCVLPYRFGTHSGWVGLCADLGVRLVAPDSGYVAEQWSEVMQFHVRDEREIDAASLTATVRRALLSPRPAPAGRNARLAERDVVRAAHDVIYRRAAGR